MSKKYTRNTNVTYVLNIDLCLCQNKSRTKTSNNTTNSDIAPLSILILNVLFATNPFIRIVNCLNIFWPLINNANSAAKQMKIDTNFKMISMTWQSIKILVIICASLMGVNLRFSKRKMNYKNTLGTNINCI